MTDSGQSERDWLHFIRSLELECVVGFMRSASGRKLLEIGGGDGHQAQALTALGFEVASVDLAPKTPSYFPVKQGNATRLDFPDHTFDIVFSSHVVAHIKDKEQAFREMKRVLKPDGIVIHIVPAAWWPVVTNFWHFLFLPAMIFKGVVRRVLGKKAPAAPAFAEPAAVPLPKGVNGVADASAEPSNRISSKWQYRLHWMLCHPLGENPSFLHEMLFFTRWYWTRLFRRYGFNVLQIKNGPLLQSGFRIFPFRALRARKLIARCCPCSLCFLMRPAAER